MLSLSVLSVLTAARLVFRVTSAAVPNILHFPVPWE